MVEGLKLNIDKKLPSNDKHAKNGNDMSILDLPKSVFSEPRHLEPIEGLKDFKNQSWRTKERVRI